MIKTLLKTASVLLFLLLVNCAFSQQVITTSGKTKTSSSGTISYSIGQTFSSLENTGIQIPFEVQIISASPFLKEMGMSCEVYPNPAANQIYLKISEPANCEFQIHSADGKLLKANNISNKTTVVPIMEFKSQILFLTVLNDKRQMKTFKIIKN